MNFFRKGNFQTVYHDNKQYFRLEYTDELWYYEWWFFNEDETNFQKIEDEDLSKHLENIFTIHYSDMKYETELRSRYS
jgi:hypothetical protein